MQTNETKADTISQEEAVGTDTTIATQAQANSTEATTKVEGESTPAETKSADDEKKFSQSDVDKIVKERLAQKESSDRKSFMEKLGVANDEELEILVRKSQAYDTTKIALDGTKKSTEELAFIKNGIDEKRYEDVRYYLKGKGLELTADNVQSELATHPEWGKQAPKATAPSPSIQVLGAPLTPTPTPDDDKTLEGWLGHHIIK